MRAALLLPGAVLVSRPLPLSAVRVTGGPLNTAQDLDAKYLLDLEPDRMLAFLRQRAGLEAKAEGYGGWDGGRGKQLTGHIAGHYLSGVSYLYAATGDPPRAMTGTRGGSRCSWTGSRWASRRRRTYAGERAQACRGRVQAPRRDGQGKTKVTVRFQAKEGSEVGTVCGVRMVRLEREA